MNSTIGATTIKSLFCRASIAMLVVAPPTAGAVDEPTNNADIAQMTAFVIEMTPLGPTFDERMVQEKTWPLINKAGAIGAEKLTCLRSGLTSVALGNAIALDVSTFATADREQFNSAFLLLKGGTASQFGSLIRVGLNQMARRPYSKEEASLQSANEKQLAALITLMGSPAHGEFRDLIGIFSRPVPPDQPRMLVGNLISGQTENIMRKRIVDSMRVCDIPPTTLFSADDLEIVFAELGEDACTDPESNTLRATDRIAQAPRVSAARTNPAPNYPAVSRYLREQGTVMLDLHVTDTGEITRAKVSKSSGFGRLDWAAAEAAIEWQLLPGEVRGKTACMWFTMPVEFKLPK